MSTSGQPPSLASSHFPDSDAPLSAVQILQIWGVFPDEKRGRSGSRPWEPHFPPYITQALNKKKEWSSSSDVAHYIACASAGVISELWADARKGDTRLAHQSSWVSGTVSGTLVHPAVDKLDLSDDGPQSKLLYLTLPHAKVERFTGIGMVCVRDPRAKSVRLLEVKRLKRSTNQLIVHLEHVGTPPRSGTDIPKGTTFDVAPFCSIKSRSAELRAIQALSEKDPHVVIAMVQPHMPIIQVQTKEVLTKRTDKSQHVRTVPDKYNKTAPQCSDKERFGCDVRSPSFIRDSSPEVDSAPSVPRHRPQLVDDPVARITEAVDQQKGLVLVQAPPGTRDDLVTMSLLTRHRQSGTQGKVLVCAQTNATVDRLCRLAISTFPSGAGHNLVVRTGDDGRFDGSVRSVSVNGLAAQQEADGPTKATLESGIGALVESHELGNISEDEFTRAVDNLATQIRDLKKQRVTEEQWRVEILRRAQFVFSTLGSAGADLLNTCQSSLLIMHGANVAREATTVIPFRHVDRAVLFGDQRQLQPIVGDVGKWIGYSSLFTRLINGGYPFFTLDRQTQYHPSIYKQISFEVYAGRVKDGPNNDILSLFLWQMTHPIWWPSTIVNVSGEEKAVKTSYVNEAEVRAVLDILRSIFDKSSMNFTVGFRNPSVTLQPFSIGLISPYAAQVTALERATSNLQIPGHITLRCGTVTSVQEEVFDASIVSCVRTVHPGFLNDINTVNVAATRGTKLRVIVGDADLLLETELWGSILTCDDAVRMAWDEGSSPHLSYTKVPLPPPYRLI